MCVPPTHTVKARLATATSFMILGMIATVVSLVLFFPFFHWILFIIGVIVSFASSKWGVDGMGDGRGLKGATMTLTAVLSCFTMCPLSLHYLRVYKLLN